MSELAIALLLGLFVLIAVLWDTFTRDKPQFHHFKPGTVSDPDVAAMVKRQLNYGLSFRKEGRSLLRPIVDGQPRGYGRSYRPVLTKQQAEQPPKADRVVIPIRRRK